MRIEPVGGRIALKLFPEGPWKQAFPHGPWNLRDLRGKIAGDSTLEYLNGAHVSALLVVNIRDGFGFPWRRSGTRRLHLRHGKVIERRIRQQLSFLCPDVVYRRFPV